jgi:hypothetical protein
MSGDYNKAKIYTIKHKTNSELTYVGSTIQSLAERLRDHKKHSKDKEKYPNHRLYSIIEDWNDWEIKIYEEFPCDNKKELLKREGEIIREIGTLNRCISGRTLKEYYYDNREQILEKLKLAYNKKKLLNT